jgi:hypothetical protein
MKCKAAFIFLLVLPFWVAYVQAAPPAVKPETTLIVLAKLVEIPGNGEFPNYPKNSVYYNHVAILKYEVVQVLKGKFAGKTIMVGQYMPRLARDKVKDQMDPFVDGDVQEIKAGNVHRLVLGTPIKKYWDRDDAVFDSYYDDEEGDRYFALRTDRYSAPAAGPKK